MCCYGFLERRLSSHSSIHYPLRHSLIVPQAGAQYITYKLFMHVLNRLHKPEKHRIQVGSHEYCTFSISIRVRIGNGSALHHGKKRVKQGEQCVGVLCQNPTVCFEDPIAYMRIPTTLARSRHVYSQIQGLAVGNASCYQP